MCDVLPGVATICRLSTWLGLFVERALYLHGSFAKKDAIIQYHPVTAAASIFTGCVPKKRPTSIRKFAGKRCISLIHPVITAQPLHEFWLTYCCVVVCRSVRCTGIHSSGLTASISLCRFQSVSPDCKVCPDCIPLAAHLSKYAHILTYTHKHRHRHRHRHRHTHTCTHKHIHKCTHTHTLTHTHTHDLFLCVAQPIPYLFSTSLACVCSTIPSVPYMSLFIVCLCVCMCVCECVSVDRHAHISAAHMPLYISVYIHLPMYVYLPYMCPRMYIYIYIYTLAHECLFTHVFVCNDSLPTCLYTSLYSRMDRYMEAVALSTIFLAAAHLSI